MRTALVLGLLATVANAYLGFDAIQSMSVATLQCLHNNGYRFYVARVWESIGRIDSTGFQNIKNAHAAGFPYVDGYVFPCHKSGCASPANQIAAAIDSIHSNGVKIGTLWLDIETQDWPGDHNTNRNFITAMANEAIAKGVTVGVYTNPHNWGTIVGNDWTGMAKHPLWWANWSGQQNFNGFTAFGGWTKPAIRQYSGDIHGPCGVSMDQNWYPG